MRNLRTRLESRDGGFTLLELLAVMIIIGILAAIAIPVFLDQRHKALVFESRSILHQDYPKATLADAQDQRTGVGRVMVGEVDFGTQKNECSFNLRTDTMTCEGAIPAPSKAAPAPSASPTTSPGTTEGSTAEPTATVTVTVTQTAS